MCQLLCILITTRLSPSMTLRDSGNLKISTKVQSSFDLSRNSAVMRPTCKRPAGSLGSLSGWAAPCKYLA